MTEIRGRLDFKGSKEEFHRFLQTDPRFFPKTPEQIRHRLTSAIDRIRPALDRLFVRFLKAPYAIKRLNPALEGSMTYGYYTVPSPLDPSGYYCFNGSNLDQRSLLNAAALAYHEIMPGHHFQMAQQRERSERPAFRRNLGHSGFQEGWAEYASSGLAMEAGMYSDPYDLYGRLMYDTFFSVRLVVDDIKRFHDALVGSGSMPLTLLEQHIDWFIAEETKKR